MATIHPFHKELLTLLYSYVGKGYKSSFSAQTLSNTIPLPQSILVKPSSLLLYKTVFTLSSFFEAESFKKMLPGLDVTII